MRIYFSNLGCKLNQAELEQMERRFRAAGHRRVDSLAEADLHVVNSCTVTHLAARDSRKLVRRGKRLNPDLKTVLTGCYVDGSPPEASEPCGVDLVVPNADKDRLVDRVLARFAAAFAPSDSVPIPYVPLELGNARVLVKVEDGCNMTCSFCVIPLTRGRQWSRPLPEILAEVRRLAAGGYREVVVTGVQISSYRWRGIGLYELTRALIERTDVARIRLTSIAPWQFDHRLVELFDSGRLCRHLHLSLQSGCRATLQRMRRPYTPGQFAELIDTLRQAIPGLAITTDVVVGFPGETDSEFDESLAFVRRAAFARLHAFPFSSRPGTLAERMPEHVAPPVKKTRMQRMLVAAAAARELFETEQARQNAEVIWEFRRDRLWFGTTDNYLRVFTVSSEDLTRRLTRVHLLQREPRGIACELLEVGRQQRKGLPSTP